MNNFERKEKEAKNKVAQYKKQHDETVQDLKETKQLLEKQQMYTKELEEKQWHKVG